MRLCDIKPKIGKEKKHANGMVLLTTFIPSLSFTFILICMVLTGMSNILTTYTDLQQ